MNIERNRNFHTYQNNIKFFLRLAIPKNTVNILKRPSSILPISTSGVGLLASEEVTPIEDPTVPNAQTNLTPASVKKRPHRSSSPGAVITGSITCGGQKGKRITKGKTEDYQTSLHRLPSV